jgi:hypothetical protein
MRDELLILESGKAGKCDVMLVTRDGMVRVRAVRAR